MQGAILLLSVIGAMTVLHYVGFSHLFKVWRSTAAARGPIFSFWVVGRFQYRLKVAGINDSCMCTAQVAFGALALIGGVVLYKVRLPVPSSAVYCCAECCVKLEPHLCAVPVLRCSVRVGVEGRLC